MIEPLAAISNTKYWKLAVAQGRLFDDFVLDEARGFTIMIELHGEVATALGEGA